MKTQSKKGFTIVELSLAMVFLSILMVSITALVMRLTAIYQKGLTLRAINSAGTEIIEDMTRTIGATTKFVEIGDEGANGINSLNTSAYVGKYYFVKNDNVNYNGDATTGNTVVSQRYGILCTGTYSYVWNSARALREDDNFRGITVQVQGGGTYRPKFAKIYDRNQSFCSEAADTSSTKVRYNNLNAARTITINKDNYYADLISYDELDLAVYEFNIVPITQSKLTNQSFASMNFIIATKNGGVNINTSSDFCRDDGNEYSEEYNNSGFSNCSVNKFTFSVRTGGSSSKEG